jgi:hypothetical protein
MGLLAVAAALLALGFARWRAGWSGRVGASLLGLAWTLWLTEAGLTGIAAVRPPVAPAVAPTWRPRALPPLAGHVVPADLGAGPSETPTVLIVGDSFAAGQGVLDRDRVGEQLSRRLSGVRVVTLAEPGWNLGDELTMVGALGPRIRPDVVLWLFVPNDVGAQVHAASDLILVRRGPPDWPLATLDALARVAWAWEVERRTLQGYRNALGPDSADLAAGIAELARLGAAVRAAGGRFVLAPYPLMHDLDAYPLAEEHQRVLDLGRAAGLETLDLLPAFAGRDARALWASVHDHHPNAEAHGLAAERLAPALDPMPTAGPWPCDQLPAAPQLVEPVRAACRAGDSAALLDLAEAVLDRSIASGRPGEAPQLPSRWRALDLATVAAAIAADEVTRVRAEAVAERARAALAR